MSLAPAEGGSAGEKGRGEKGVMGKRKRCGKGQVNTVEWVCEVGVRGGVWNRYLNVEWNGVGSEKQEWGL